MRDLVGTVFAIFGIYLVFRPDAYAAALAAWAHWVVPNSRLFPSDGRPEPYKGFARAGGLFFLLVGMLIMIWGFE